ncbi:hypothetical protein BH23ACT9_BH23ACT9_10950 [soil metagenome]
MSSFTQVAFQLSDEELRQLDESVPAEFPSRAAALRSAVHEWLERRRQAQIDAHLEAGYAAVPEDIGMTEGLAAVNRDALAEAGLDW